MFTTTAVLVAVLVGSAVAAAGEKDAAATNLEELRGRLASHDHNWMMFATVEALSAAEREYLEPELELLVTVYTNFPDQNWSNYGRWGGWSGFPDAGRTPDVRREWEISHACGYSPASRRGTPLGLHGVGYDGASTLFPRVVRLLKAGEHGKAIRMMGAMAHPLQDAATFPHMQALHRVGALGRYSAISIAGYRPLRLGDSAEEAAEALARRNRQMVHFTEKVSLDIRTAIACGDVEKNRALRVKCCNEAAKLVADAIHTAILLAGPKAAGPPTPPERNLVVNGNLEEDDFGEAAPAGWVAHWNNPMDRLGRLEWEGLVARNQNLWHSGRHSLKLMWADKEGLQWRQTWPAAVWVAPGQRYRATGWVKTVQATGKTTLGLQFATRAAEPLETVWSDPICGDRNWTQLAVQSEVPAGAERLRVILASQSNEGAAWFDDISLVRLGPDRTPAENLQAAKPKEPKTEDLLLWLSFDEGKGTGVGDRSPFAGINGPNLLASGGGPHDLFVAKGLRGAAVGLDGKDDFVECPFSYVQDVQCPKEAMTLMLWVWIENHHDAVLVAKQQRLSGQPARGYCLRLAADGRVRFTVHTERGPAMAESADRMPTGRWTHVAAVRSPDGHLIVYVDGRPGSKHELAAAPLIPEVTQSGFSASLYLGADTGVRDFFAGKLDELRLLGRGLDPAQIAKEIEGQRGLKEAADE